MATSKIAKRNLELTKKMGIVGSQVKDFARIRSWGDKGKAITHDGLEVERQDFFFAEGYGIVKTIPYELHFVFEDKSKKKGRWAFMCTCGSLAGIISYNEVKHLMTVNGDEPGYVLACIAHTTSKQNIGIGRHADGSTE